MSDARSVGERMPLLEPEPGDSPMPGYGTRHMSATPIPLHVTVTLSDDDSSEGSTSPAMETPGAGPSTHVPAADSNGRAPPKKYTCKCEVQSSNGKRGRNLVVCIDGTANQFGLQNTHVVELHSRLTKDKYQLTYYDSGIGTFVKDSSLFWLWWQMIVHGVDMAIAWNLKSITLSAYQWISEVYQDGDRIFLLGFSRGAYQARILAGMIHKVGLLHRGNTRQIPFAYELYVADTSNGSRTSRDLSVSPPTPAELREVEQKGRSDPRYTTFLCWKFKQALSHKDVSVHFVGAWDTVSSVGIVPGPTLPETTTGMRHVHYFRHALSLDERRTKFLPEYANGVHGPLEEEHIDAKEPLDDGRVREVWFPGSHSDIGGGNAPNLGLDKFGPALRWMMYQGLALGLRVESFQGSWVGPTHVDSMQGWFWKVLEVLPLPRLSYIGDGEKTWAPHLSQGRVIRKGQRIHSSAVDYMTNHMNEDSKYTPAARFHDGRSWDTIKNLPRNDATWRKLIEEDLYAEEVKTFLRQLQDEPVAAYLLDEGYTKHLERLVASAVARQALLDDPTCATILLNALRRVSETPDLANFKHGPYQDTVAALVSALVLFDFAPAETSLYPYRTIEKWLPDTVAMTHREKISRIFSVMKGHEASIMSVTFSPDGTYIASASFDSTIRLWDARTFSPAGEPLRGHRLGVNSIAFSPDSARIASGGDDDTVRIWDVQTRQAVGEPLRGHYGTVSSVAFSADSKTFASGSWDRTIRLWDAATGGAVGEPFSGHEGPVFSVAFAHNDTRLVSGSADETIRIWDVETHEVLKVLEGHTNWVRSIAVSHDGTRIVSGSDDDTIRMWDAETGQAVGAPIRGHTGSVTSVAFSPDDRYVVSGSWDQTVRLWRADTGEAVGQPLRGHTGWVRSVAFSPDGKRIVSGSMDNTLRIW